jgi:hypothetical protein
MKPRSDCEGHSNVLSLRKKCEKSEVDLSLQKREDGESRSGCPCSFPQIVNRGWING